MQPEVELIGGGGGGFGSTMRYIWEKFRAALGISGGSHSTAPTLSASDAAAAGDAASVGDLLSALPDDLILLVLLHLPSAAEAARTCVLSRRWRTVWTQLPELRFPLPAEPARALPSPVAARAALALHAAPALRLLSVVANDADPWDVAAVLRLAAPRLTGELFFDNVVPEDRKDREVAKAGVRADVELHCFDRAEQLILRLGYLRLLLPPSAVFTKLTVLDLAYVRFPVQFPGAPDIGDAFSSIRCPSLQELCLFDTKGVAKLTICSESLLSLCLHTVEGMQQLTVRSPMLINLQVFNCFYKTQPVVDIVAPSLEAIDWADIYDPSSVQLGKLAQLQILSTLCFAAELEHNWGIVVLLQRFWKIPTLIISIVYPPNEMVSYQYLMEALTLLPVENLHLQLGTSGHTVIPCVFHFLKISTSIRSLFLHICEAVQEQTACSPGCMCHQPQVWKTEELCLNSLLELHICGFNGADHDFAFVKRLLGWTPVLEIVTIIFDPRATIDEELCKELHDLSRPETCIKFYLSRDAVKDKVPECWRA